jgi:tRNA 2-thiouridine synthesizing protein A
MRHLDFNGPIAPYGASGRLEKPCFKSLARKPRMNETTLDLLGLKCPLPALKTRKALKSCTAGDVLIVLCNDPLAEIDIPNLLRETGDSLAGKTREADRLVFRIVKA